MSRTLLSLISSLLLAVLTAGYSLFLNERDVEARLANLSQQVATQLQAHILSVEHGLRGARGIAITAPLDLQRFSRYIGSRELAREFPGVLGFLFLEQVSADQLTAYLAGVRAEQPDFGQPPAPDGDRQLLVRYALPADGPLAVGSTLANSHWPALARAQTSNQLVLSPLAADPADYLALLPVQGQARPTWVAAPVSLRRMFSVLGQAGEVLSVDLHDDPLHFRHNPANPRYWQLGRARGQDIVNELSLTVGGRQWQLTVRPKAAFYKLLSPRNFWLAGLVAGAVGLLMAGLLALLAQVRREHQSHERSQQEQLGQLIDAAPCGMMFMDSHGHMVAVNHRLCELTGYSRRELAGSSLRKLSQDKRWQPQLPAPGEQQDTHAELVIQRKDGQCFPATLKFSCQPLGASHNIVGTLEDISQQRRIERQISDSEARLRLMANAMPQHVWLADPSGEITYANQRCLDYFGQPFDQLTDNRWLDAMHPDDRQAVIDGWRVSADSGDDFQAEFRLRDLQGQYRWFIARAVAARDARDQITVWYGTNTDITDAKRLQLELADQARNTEAIIDSVLDAIITIDERGLVQNINTAAEQLFGYREAQLVGKNVSQLMPEPHRSQHDRYLHNYLTSGHAKVIGKSVNLKGQHKNGTEFDMELRVAELFSSNRRLFMGMVRDVTERNYNEQLLTTQDHVLSLIASNAPLVECLDALARDIEKLSPDMLVSVLLLDPTESRLLHCTAPSLPPAFNAAINGEPIGPTSGSCGTAAFLHKPVMVSDIANDPLWADYRALALQYGLRACWSTPILQKNKLLGTFALYFRTPRLPEARHQRLINMATHVASMAIAHEQRETKIKQLAFYDALTKLPNRSLGMDRLKRAIADAQRRQENLAVLFIDLDQFKTVNDSLGHHVGDLLLKQAAQRLLHCVRDNDSVARLGGDEFFVILNGTHNNIAEVVSQKILAAMTQRFSIDHHLLHLSCSIGIALYPQDGLDETSLLRNADTAMYRAKEMGRNNIQYYTDDMNRAALERITLEQEIRAGMARDEFLLYYQPRINDASGEIVGLEALIRWQHPSRGLLAPNYFIPVAEQTGLIVALGDWVLKKACSQLKLWLDHRSDPVAVAVNLSPRQFTDKQLIDKVETVLKESQLPPALLELEITESMVMDEGADILAQLVRLKKLGVTLAIDDFGTGYSNLSRLKHLPVDVIKIDKSFVDGIPDDNDDTAITSTIIAMARHLRLKIVAEGVETHEQRQFLSEKGCDEMQGYLFGKPQETASVADLIGVKLTGL